MKKLAMVVAVLGLVAFAAPMAKADDWRDRGRRDHHHHHHHHGYSGRRDAFFYSVPYRVDRFRNDCDYGYRPRYYSAPSYNFGVQRGYYYRPRSGFYLNFGF